MSYFCLHCRTQLPAKQWKLLNKFWKLFNDVYQNSASWGRISALQLPYEEVQIANVSFTKIIFEYLATKKSREQLYNSLQSYKVFVLLQDRTLDIIELLEEYDEVTKEK